MGNDWICDSSILLSTMDRKYLHTRISPINTKHILNGHYAQHCAIMGGLGISIETSQC